MMLAVILCVNLPMWQCEPVHDYTRKVFTIPRKVCCYWKLSAVALYLIIDPAVLDSTAPN